MTTAKPKLQGYVPSRVFAAYHQWKKKNRIKQDSTALETILSEFLGLTDDDGLQPLEGSDHQMIELTARLEALEASLEKRISHLEAYLHKENNPLNISNLPKESEGKQVESNSLNLINLPKENEEEQEDSNLPNLNNLPVESEEEQEEQEEDNPRNPDNLLVENEDIKP